MPNNDYSQTPIGTADDEFIIRGQAVKDTAIVDLINTVQMYYGMADISAAAPVDPKGRIPKGTVTIGDVSSVYVYDNYLFTITVTGAQLRKYLEYSVSRYYKTYSPGDTKFNKNSSIADYNLDILQGVNYTIDLTKNGLFDVKGNLVPQGESRIIALSYEGTEVLDNQVFKLAINNYRFKGGGGFLAAAGIKPQNKDPKEINYICFDSQKSLGDEGGLIRNLIIKYFQDMASGKIIKGRTSVQAVCDNNWVTTPRFYDILHLSDLHGDIDNTPTTGTPRINAALISGAINYDRNIYGNERTLLLSAGDMLQGEAISNILKGTPVIDIMNQMQLDAMQLGNHEFDWGLEALNNNISRSKFIYLTANMTLNPGDTDIEAIKFERNRKPWVIMNKDGLKVGIIGVAHPDTIKIVSAKTIGHFSFQDPADTINNLIPEIKKVGAHIIVVVAHIGDQYNDWPSEGIQPDKAPLEEELAELTRKLRGVAAVLGGNSHTINYDLIPDADGNLIPSVVGNSSGIAVIRLALDLNNKVVNAIPNYLDIYDRLYNAIDSDKAVQAIVDSTRVEVGTILNEVIGKAEVDMKRYSTSDTNLDSNLGNWATDVMKISSKADFAFLNYGALRTSIEEGNITTGTIWTVMPFDNEISLINMTGEQIKTILEFMVSDIKPCGHVSGLYFNYNPDALPRFILNSKGDLEENPSNSRVLWITLVDGTPIDLGKIYKVAASDFIATGGDYYPLTANSSNMVSTEVFIRDAMINDIRERKILNYQSEGRIKVGELSTYMLIKPDLSNMNFNQQITRSLGIKTLTIGSSGYFKARIDVSVDKPKDAVVEMLFQNENSSSYLDAVTLGYLGNEAGMVVTPDFNKTQSFKLRFSRAGIYTIKYTLVDLITGEAIAAESSTFTVLNPKPTISTTLDAFAIKGEKNNFYVNIKANNTNVEEAYVRITLVDHDGKPSAKLKYKDSKGKYKDLKFNKMKRALYPEKGEFALEDTEIQFEISFDKEDFYIIKFELMDGNSYEVLSSKTATVKVVNKKDEKKDKK